MRANEALAASVAGVCRLKGEMPDTPAVTSIPAVAAIAQAIIPAIHGPYEDMFLEGLKLLTIVINDAPAAVKVELWNNFLAFQNGVHTFASKIDVLHLFHANQ